MSEEQQVLDSNYFLCYNIIMNRSCLKNFEENGLRFGRLVSSSKSGYLDKYPTHKVVFNSRIYDLKTYEKEKNKAISNFFAGMEIEIWYGDLDLDVDSDKLQAVAKEIGTFVITTESGVYVSTFKGEK